MKSKSKTKQARPVTLVEAGSLAGHSQQDQNINDSRLLSIGRGHPRQFESVHAAMDWAEKNNFIENYNTGREDHPYVWIKVVFFSGKSHTFCSGDDLSQDKWTNPDKREVLADEPKRADRKYVPSDAVMRVLIEREKNTPSLI